MKNSHSPLHDPSFQSASTPTSKSPEAFNALSDHFSSPQSHIEEIHLKKAQDVFDGLLNYVYCTNDEIIEIANQIEKNSSTADVLIEALKNHKALLDKSKDSEILIQEKSPLGKRPNPYLDQLDKETVENLQDEPILEDSEDFTSNPGDDSIDSEEYDADLSISTDVVPKTYKDQETQTNPILSLQDIFKGPPQVFLYFYLPQDQNTTNNEVKPQEKSQEEGGPHKPLIVVQPVYFFESQKLFDYLPKTASLVSEPINED